MGAVSEGKCRGWEVPWSGCPLSPRRILMSSLLVRLF